jgi:hypothetical protein
MLSTDWRAGTRLLADSDNGDINEEGDSKEDKVALETSLDDIVKETNKV